MLQLPQPSVISRDVILVGSLPSKRYLAAIPSRAPSFTNTSLALVTDTVLPDDEGAADEAWEEEDDAEEEEDYDFSAFRDPLSARDIARAEVTSSFS